TEIQRATLSNVAIHSGERVLTLVEDRLARTNREFANLSAYDLALWIAQNWWRLRWEPESGKADANWSMAHSLAAIGGGYVWPNVLVVSDGEQVRVQARPTRGERWEPIRYLESWDLSLTACEFEGALSSFVESVLARLASFRIENSELQALWQELKAERFDPEVSNVRKREALLGFDAGEAPDELLDQLAASAQREGSAAVDEVAAQFQSQSPEILTEVNDLLTQQGAHLEAAGLQDLAAQGASWDQAGPPWERATKAAQLARKFWGLGRERPVSNKQLLELVGGSADLITGHLPSKAPISAARRSAVDPAPLNVVLRSWKEEGRRFDLCRLVADSLQAPRGERLLPATKSKTSRQKFQRAFSQEFLCPSEALEEYFGSAIPDDEDIEDAARHFEVSPLLVRSKLANLDILPRF
ncbi:MAG TPA: hypothetical protein VGE98_06265, partial [Thermoanaerobaculia bacterium]